MAITFGVLLAMYFGAAVLFVTQSHARVDGDSNPTPPPPCEQVIVKDDSPGHFKLALEKSETLRDSHWRMLTHMLKKDLERRFGEVEILTFGDLATSERPGLIHVEIESLKERPYWGPSGLGSERTLLPCYIALRMTVRCSCADLTVRVRGIT